MATVAQNIGVTPASFVVDFPEFANQSAYPPAVIGYYLALANILLNPCAWGGTSGNVVNNVAVPTSPPQFIIDFAAELFVAHHVTLEFQAQRAAAAGAVPGLNTGAVASKAVGPVSQSFDNVVASLGDESGEYNLTVYGKRFYRLVTIAGAGPMQLGVGGAGPAGFGLFTPASAWLGPPMWPGWFWNT